MAKTDIKVDVEIPDLFALPDASPSDPLEALSWLGETVEEVAEGLRARGIKGTPRDAHACVLAKYLQIWWGDAVIACGSGWFEGSLSPQWRHPEVLIKFENEFDNRHFPDLIDNG